jgi:hypothetical protein
VATKDAIRVVNKLQSQRTRVDRSRNRKTRAANNLWRTRAVNNHPKTFAEFNKSKISVGAPSPSTNPGASRTNQGAARRV